MSAPTLVAGRTAATRSLRAMASPLTLTVVEPNATAASRLDRAEAAVREIERTCSRFDPHSALSRANADPDSWHVVPQSLARAVQEAADAHLITGGLFEPRVLGVLLAWGYDRSLPFAEGIERDEPAGLRTEGKDDLVGLWSPEVREDRDGWHLRLGGHPIDLGGIGKGLAVRAAADALAGAGRGASVDLGGDGALVGAGPTGPAWRIGVEDPAGGDEPLLVLQTTGTAYATSSTRLRSWHVGGRPVHHLVDPRTGEPGGSGLRSVTVLAPDPAWSEVWSKTLFLAGPTAVRRRAEELGLAAAWVDADGTIGTTAHLDPSVMWRRTHA